MINILVGKVYLFPPIFLGTGHLYDWHCCSFDKFHILDVLLHLFLLQDELDLSQQLQRVHLKLFFRRGYSNIDVRLLQAQLSLEGSEHLQIYLQRSCQLLLQLVYQLHKMAFILSVLLLYNLNFILYFLLKIIPQFFTLHYPYSLLLFLPLLPLLFLIS